MFAKIDESVEKFQDDIYDAKFNQAGEILVGLIEDIAGFVGSIPEKKMPEFNSIITDVFAAQQKQDYLLISDLLEYKLQPFLHSIGKKMSREKDK